VFPQIANLKHSAIAQHYAISSRDEARDAAQKIGFPVVVHPHEPDTVYVFPLGGGDGRYPPDAKARVWRSQDAGKSWEALGEGLPDQFYVGVMRDAMSADTHEQAGLYFGARNGTVWGSVDSGESWRQVVGNLPDVVCVRAAVL